MVVIITTFYSKKCIDLKKKTELSEGGNHTLLFTSPISFLNVPLTRLAITSYYDFHRKNFSMFIIFTSACIDSYVWRKEKSTTRICSANLLASAKASVICSSPHLRTDLKLAATLLLWFPASIVQLNTGRSDAKHLWREPQDSS